MKNSKIYLGESLLKKDKGQVEGEFVTIHDEKYYKISHYDQMPNFFMTLVSDSDHWMFISSNGSLSAGRKDRDNALFPYYGHDKIHDYSGITGNKTLILVEKEGKTFLWEPFTKEMKGVYTTERNLYKNVFGNKLIFEEINKDLEICFQYGWSYSEKFGFVKTSTLKNTGDQIVTVNILDGIRNLLPHGVEYAFQNEYSNLLDAYKKAELLERSLKTVPVQVRV